MDSFWQIALGVGGVAAIGAFLFLSLYRGWLKLDIFPKLTKRQTFTVMMTFLVLVFLALIAFLLVYCFRPQIEPTGDPRKPAFVISGEIAIENPSVRPNEVRVGLLWGVQDDRFYFWPVGSVERGDEDEYLRYTIRIEDASPPEDALMFISAAELTGTPGSYELITLGVAAMIAYADSNRSGVFETTDRLLGVSRRHVFAYLDGPFNELQELTQEDGDRWWSLPQGFSLAESIPPSELGLIGGLDVVRSVQPETRVLIVIPENERDIEFPDWT
jgi:hypothetical protein